MNCPVCEEKMREVDRSGVTIDICPGCKGVWLDRGELDKIIERSTASLGSQPAAAQPPVAHPAAPAPQAVYGHGKRDGHDDHDDHQGYGKHGKRSFLRDLFD